jgi:hypothetical protein
MLPYPFTSPCTAATTLKSHDFLVPHCAPSKERDQGIHHPKAISGKSVKANRRGTNSIDSQDYFEKNGVNDFRKLSASEIIF